MGAMGRGGGPGGGGDPGGREAPFVQPPEDEAGPNAPTVDIIRQGPPDRQGETGFPESARLPGGNGGPQREPAAAVGGSALPLAGLSLGVLFAGLPFALLYRRRGR